MSNLIDDIVVELIKDIKVLNLGFRGVYLFGLFVDGKMHKDEDIEFVAIFDKPIDKVNREQIWRVIGKIEEDFDIYIDLHPLSLSEFKSDTNFYKYVIEEGIFFNSESI
ncbi:nucleotidyltransferase domain-containing protein [bacterium]|nr:nucleotidyltransferase domain-containing protein [bacterium]